MQPHSTTYIKPHAGRPKTPIENRFWAKVRKTDTCWVWTGMHNELGYGRLRVGTARQGVRYAHRVSYTLHYGHIPEGQCVLHSCDNPPCVNPEHLRIGTRQENLQEMFTKHRQGGQWSQYHRFHGSNHNKAKLTEHKVTEIRHRYAMGETNRIALSIEYEVSRSTIDLIINRKTWRHI